LYRRFLHLLEFEPDNYWRPNVITRRRALFALTATSFAHLIDPRAARSQPLVGTSEFDSTLAKLAEKDLEAARAYRELEYRVVGPSTEELQAQPGLARRFSTEKTISNRARDMLILFEVSGKASYEARYRKPIWPKGLSGVTIGIGYDVGYVNKDLLASDWNGLLSAPQIAALEGACGISGSAAGDLVAFVQTVDVPWTAATAQLDRMLKFVGGETLNAFPGAEKLSADSFGALVSLVYNRGSGMKSANNDTIDRRREMRNIRQALSGGRVGDVANEIRNMKRIWSGQSDARGLLARRDLEAQLFEIGMKN
jgi:GH24 family phage-related lysozyme (muramidase)